MLIHFDEWSTCYTDSGFTLDMPVVPRIGEHMVIHRSLMNPRFFDSEGQERFLVPEHLQADDDGMIDGIIQNVQYTVKAGGEVMIEVDIDFGDL